MNVGPLRRSHVRVSARTPRERGTVGTMHRVTAIRGFLLIALTVSACSTGSSTDGGRATSDTSADTPVASAVELAPSQLTASTVAEPGTPVPCPIDDLDLWTAQVRVSGPVTAAVVRVRNVGDVTCEVDISRSPEYDPVVEPGVWLGPGETADLAVESATGCEVGSEVDVIEVVVGDELVDVPTMPAACGWRPAAFYPNDPAGVGCARSDLDVATTASTLLVRNGSARPCLLGGIVEVDGATTVTRGRSGVAIDELQPGDIVAFGRRDGQECGEPAGRVELFDEEVGALVFDDVPCGFVVELGGGRPWFGPARAPAGDAGNPPVDEDGVLGALSRLDGGA